MPREALSRAAQLRKPLLRSKRRGIIASVGKKVPPRSVLAMIAEERELAGWREGQFTVPAGTRSMSFRTTREGRLVRYELSPAHVAQRKAMDKRGRRRRG